VDGLGVSLSTGKERGTSLPLSSLSSSSALLAALDPDDEAIAFSEIPSISYTGVKSGADEADPRVERGVDWLSARPGMIGREAWGTIGAISSRRSCEGESVHDVVLAGTNAC